MSHYDAELESAVIGTMVLSPAFIDFADVDADDFSQDINKTILKALLKMRANNRAISAYTLSLDLRGKKVRVDELASHWTRVKFSTLELFIEGCRKLKELTVMRELSWAVGMGYSPDEVLDKANELQTRLTDESIPTLDDSYEAFLEEYEQKKSGELLMSLTTGLPTIDASALFERGGLVTVAARSSVGKSSFALSIAKNVAYAGKRVLFVSVEMSVPRLMDRLVSMITGIPLKEIRAATVDITTVKDEIDRIKDNLGIVFLPHATSQQVSRIVSREHRRKPVDLVIIDYLQLLCDPRGKNITDDIRIGNITRAFKVMAGKLNNSVMLLSQVNRMAATEENGMPKLHQLRGSGNIEQDSDAVLILNRQSKADAFGELMIAKNRNGVADVSIPILFDSNTTEYTERVKSQYEAAHDIFYK